MGGSRAFVTVEISSSKIAKKLAACSPSEKPALRRKFSEALVHDARAMAERYFAKSGGQDAT